MTAQKPETIEEKYEELKKQFELAQNIISGLLEMQTRHIDEIDALRAALSGSSVEAPCGIGERH